MINLKQKKEHRSRAYCELALKSCIRQLFSFKNENYNNNLTIPELQLTQTIEEFADTIKLLLSKLKLNQKLPNETDIIIIIRQLGKYRLHYLCDFTFHCAKNINLNTIYISKEIIKASLYNNQIDYIWSIIDANKEHDFKIYAIVMDIAGKNKHFRFARTVFLEAKKKNILNSFCYNIMINNASMCHDIHSAFAFFKEAIDHNLVSFSTYRTMINAAQQNNDPDIALQAFQAANNKGLVDTVTCNLLLDLLYDYDPTNTAKIFYQSIDLYHKYVQSHQSISIKNEILTFRLDGFSYASTYFYLGHAFAFYINFHVIRTLVFCIDQNVQNENDRDHDNNKEMKLLLPIARIRKGVYQFFNEKKIMLTEIDKKITAHLTPNT